MTFLSIGCAVGTYLVLDYSEFDCDVTPLRLPLWMVFGMHIVNSLETLMNLTGLEQKICHTYVLTGFFIFELVVLVFMQVAYFEAQECITQTTLMYFWLMFQIFVFYVVFSYFVFYALFFCDICPNQKQHL